MDVENLLRCEHRMINTRGGGIMNLESYERKKEL
jgi:hypothetical protein